MGYSRQVYMEAENELNRRHSEAVGRAQQRLDDFYAVCPEAEDVRRRIASTASQAAKAVLRGTDVRASLEALKAENLGLQRRFAELLAEHGFARADIDRSMSAQSARIPAMWTAVCAPATARCCGRSPTKT